MQTNKFLNEARQMTGLNDFGDESFLEPMSRLLASIGAESRLSELGKSAVHGMIIGRLVNRLMLEDWYRRHPEIDDQEIVAPVFISGLPRTGSTALGHMLALDPDTRSLRAWEAEKPCPPPETATEHSDARIAESRERAKFFEKIAPGVRDALPRSVIAPEECFALLDLSFSSFASDGFLHVPSYIAWLMKTGEVLEPAYRYHRRVLKLLQWRCPPRRWQLRTPVHMYGMSALIKVYPDAQFVMTHRDPLRAIPSTASLMHMVRSAFLADPMPRELGQEVLNNWTTGIQRMLEFRDQIGDSRFFDIAHRDQIRNPIPQIRSLYQWLGWNFSQEMENRIELWRMDNPKGDHNPDVALFGISLDEVRGRFKPYVDRFSGLF